MDDLKQLLYEESRYKMSDELFERFIGATTEVDLKNREVLIPYGKLDTNLYVQKSGILRACWFDGENEKTDGFALPGSIVMSYHSHFMRLPAFFQVESCGESSVLKLSKQQLDSLVDSSNEFAKWFIAVQSAQLYLYEFKHSAITGNVKERYQALVKNRPEILNRVPVKIVASYLGITPNYLSHLKNAAKTEEK